MKKMIAFILCAAIMFSIVGCTDTEPQGNPALDMYTQASEGLNSLTDITSELLITTLTTVNGDEISQQSAQTLTYQGKGTDEAMIALDEELLFSVHVEKEEDDEEDEPVEYSEIWYQGTVYTQMNEEYQYCSEVGATEIANRYTPVVLLDASLYGSISAEETEGGNRILFAQPSAAEGWAIPQDAQFEEASGSALVTAEGKLAEMNYTVTYTYGPSLVKVTVQSKPLDTPKTVALPEDMEDYVAVEEIDALRTGVCALANLMQADSMTFRNTENLVSDAAAVVRNLSTEATVHGRKKDTIAKIESSLYFKNYSTGETEEYNLEETFLDKKLTTVTNHGLPTTSTGVSWEDIREYIAGLLIPGMAAMDYWKEISITDLGSTYLLEYQLNDDFGNNVQNSVCTTLWQDPSFLINLSSKYENADVNGYMSIDKYTGLPVATGYYYKGIHTIEGHDYGLTFQFNQSIEAPAVGAYMEITDKRPVEEEPENKPTPLLYEVTGENGQKMWLFGTIHVGDERTAYLPDQIRNAFMESDALALECNTEAFEAQLEEDEALAAQVSDLYFYSNGKEVIKELLPEEEYTLALKLLKAVGGHNQNMPYAKPYVWSSSIEDFYLRQGYQLHRDQGVEERLMDWAEEYEKEILEIESSLAQIKMLTGYSDELQTVMLQDILESDAQEYWTDVMDLFEKWCAGDETVLREKIATEWDNSELTEDEIAKLEPLREEYYQAMSFDRNEAMLDVAIDYLESGEVIFYAVGLAHLLDDTNGLVDALREAGYTVEAVSYAA